MSCQSFLRPGRRKSHVGRTRRQERGRTGINVWVRVHDETRAVGVLRDAGYAVSPGMLYRIGSPQAIRISIGSLDPAAIEPLADVILTAAGPGRGQDSRTEPRRYVQGC